MLAFKITKVLHTPAKFRHKERASTLRYSPNLCGVGALGCSVVLVVAPVALVAQNPLPRGVCVLWLMDPNAVHTREHTLSVSRQVTLVVAPCSESMNVSNHDCLSIGLLGVLPIPITIQRDSEMGTK